MNGKTVSSNRHIVDQLADIRATMKSLKADEDTLKGQISEAMGSADSLGGDEFIARQTLTERKGSIDTKAMEAAGIDIERYRKPGVSVYALKVERRVLEDA